MDNSALILEKLEQLNTKMDEQFSKVNNRLDKIEQRLDKVEQRLDKVEQRLDILEANAEEVKPVVMALRHGQEVILAKIDAIAHKTDQHHYSIEILNNRQLKLETEIELLKNR